jgi:hypothetical protein
MALKAVCTGSHLKVAYAMTKDPVLLAGPSLRGASAVWASGGRHHPLEQGCIPQASSRLGGLAWGHMTAMATLSRALSPPSTRWLQCQPLCFYREASE